MIVIPCGEPRYAVGTSLWSDAVETFAVFAQCELSRPGSRIVKVFREDPEEPVEVLPVLVSLTPRPDNTYNPRAISVTAPADYGGSIFDRHLGYMYDRNLTSLGEALHALAETAGMPIGCHAYFELFDECCLNPDEGLPPFEHRGRRYDTGSLRLCLPWWEDLQALAVAYSRSKDPFRILPFIGRYASWLPGARDQLVAQVGEETRRIDVELRIVQNQLYAAFGELLLAQLTPHHRDYFERTRQRVVELGGTAVGKGERRSGSLTVFVEDVRGPDEGRYKSA